MKYLLLIIFTIFSFGASASDVEQPVIVVKPQRKVKIKIPAKNKKNTDARAVAVGPCDSKEDILKKLKEKEKVKVKAETDKPKGFSLQGGDTGCSVK